MSTYIYFFAENTLICYNNEDEHPLTVSSHIYIPGTITEDAREQFRQEILVLLFLL